MKTPTKDVALSIVLSGMLALALLVFLAIGREDTFFLFAAENGITLEGIKNLFINNTKTELILCWCFATAVLFALTVIIKRIPKCFFKKLYRYRYLFGVIIIALCVLFELSGSSLSWFSLVFPSMQGKTSTLFRTYNPMRSDEFVLNSIFAVSQEKNPGQAYSYFSDIVRGTRTDMFIIYGQPVWHYGIIFRPFQIGYLLFGSSKGLSFFWCARLVMLFLVTFDFGMFLTEGKKKLSLCLATMTALAPVVQWWFAINGLVEMLIFGQLCVLMLNRYMQEKPGYKRILYSAVFFWSGGCFALVFYPSWQIPFGYVFLSLMIAVIIMNRKMFTWSWKKDFIPLLIIILIWVLLIGGLLLKSRDTISTVLNTAYPGNRIFTNKLTIRRLFAYVYNIFLPFIDLGTNVEESVFIDFFPLGIILSAWYMIRYKRKDPFLIAMNSCSAIMLAIYLLPVPEWVLRITLLSIVQSTRALIAISFLNLLILFRVFALKQEEWTLPQRLGVTVVYPAVAILIAVHAFSEIKTTWLMILIMAVVLAGGIFLLSYNNKERMMNLALTFVIVIFAFCGGLVNPVQKGIDFLLENPLIETISTVASEDDGKWIVEGTPFWGDNLPLLGGAPTINSTNVYPNLQLWAKIDPDMEYEEIYNRYAHIPIEFTDTDETSFTLIQADLFEVKLNINDLKKLEVSFVLSINELENYSSSNVSFEKLSSYDGWSVYRVIYR